MNKKAYTEGYLNKEAISIGKALKGIGQSLGGGSKFRFAGKAKNKAKDLQRITDQKTINNLMDFGIDETAAQSKRMQTLHNRGQKLRGIQQKADSLGQARNIAGAAAGTAVGVGATNPDWLGTMNKSIKDIIRNILQMRGR